MKSCNQCAAPLFVVWECVLLQHVPLRQVHGFGSLGSLLGAALAVGGAAALQHGSAS